MSSQTDTAKSTDGGCAGARARPLLLGAYWSKWCPRRIHNEFDPTITPVEELEPSEAAATRMQAGADFEHDICDRFAQECADLVDLNDCCDTSAELIDATVAAMDAGTLAILGGQLPDDIAGGRTGRPDVLIHAGQHCATGVQTYLPADVKHHRATTRSSKAIARLSSLSAPTLGDAQEVPGLAPGYREDDCIQLAHYWRMLQACGRAPEAPATGAIIGTDQFDDGMPMIVWHDLTSERFRTGSRSNPRGWKRRSALDRYDYEHAFRLRVAAVAKSRTGTDTDPEPLIASVYVDECDSCPWGAYCVAELGQDVSVRVGGLDAREWQALRELGVTTVEALAAVDVDAAVSPDGQDAGSAELVAAFCERTRHQVRPLPRLSKAVVNAQLMQAGLTLGRTTSGPIGVPRADIEVDFDIEWDRQSRVYMWGLLINNRVTATSHFEHVSSFLPLDDSSAAQLGAAAWSRLREIGDEAAAAGRSLRVYHYSHPEPSNLRKLAGSGLRSDLPSAQAVEQFVEAHFEDLHTIMKANFVGRFGLGLKAVATHGAGFEWRDETPGGAESQAWLDQAYCAESQQERDSARDRILAYNEDDCRATLAVREWLVGVR